MISNPSLILTFTAADLEAGHGSVQTVTGNDLLTRSISIEHRLLDGLKPSSDKAQLSIRKGAPVTEDIIRTEGDINAVLMDGSETLFTGYVSTNFSWSVTDYGEETLSITIEDVGTRLLEKSFITEGFHLFQCEAYRAVEAIAERAGITISPDSQKPTVAVVRSVEGDESCKELLTELLYELGYVYAFDEYGEMYLHKVSVTTLSGIPSVDSSSLVSVGGTAVSLRKKIRQYRTARVSFQRLGEADDYLVYRDTTGQGDGHPYCYHELQGGERFDGTENYTLTGGETRTPAYIEAVNAASETEIVGSNEIVAVTDLRTVFAAASGSINAFCSLAGGKYIKVHAENTGRTPAYITRLDAYGSILYVKDENAVIASGGSLSTDDGSTLKEEMEWIHDEENAKAHANLLASYQRNAGSEYTFTSFLELAPGSVAHLEDDVFTGLSVNVLIVSKVTTDESDVYQYGAVGVSIFNLDADVISETFVRGDTQLKGEDAITYFLDSTADIIKSDAAVTVKPFRRAGLSKAENIVCTLRLEAATGYGTAEEEWAVISEEDASSVAFTPSQEYGAYRVTMIVSNEEVCRKTIPRIYDGEKGETVSISASRSIVDYYADGFPVDDSDITVSAHANGSISIYIGDDERPAATGDGEVVLTIKPSDYLDEASSVTIRSVSGKAEDTATIMRNTFQGSLEISSSTLSFAYYADNVPHDDKETAAITVKAVNYKAFPTLRLDGMLLETPDEHEYTVDISVNELLSKESIELRAYVHTRSEALTIIKKMDRGILTIVSDRYSFGYYADNEPHNATEAATISISQEGYSGMPDLYVRGLKTDYADGTYSLPSSMLQNASSVILEIRKGSDRASIEIRKELDTASVRLFLSRDRVTYYHDNVRISGDIPLSVMYSGLFYPPKVKAGNTDIPITDGKGTIPASLLDDEAATEVEVSAYSDKVPYASDTAIIRKELLQLSLSFTLSAAQFGYGSDGEITPESITVTNTTSGLSDNSKPILKLAGIPVTWSPEGTFIITPDMVEGRYLTVEIVYGDETRSAIITKTFDGKMLRLSADSQFFRLSPSGKPVDGQEITLRVHTQGIEDEVIWTDNKGLRIPAGTKEYILRTGGGSEPEEPDESETILLDNLSPEIGDNSDFADGYSYGYWAWNNRTIGENQGIPGSDTTTPFPYTHTADRTSEAEYQEYLTAGYIPSDMSYEDFALLTAAMNQSGCMLGGWLLVDAPDQERNREAIGIVTRLFGSRDDREKRIYIRMKVRDAVNTPEGFGVAVMYSIQNPGEDYFIRHDWCRLSENADGSWSGIMDFSFTSDLEFIQGIVYLMPVPANDFNQTGTASYFIDEFALVPLSEYEESILHEDDAELLSILNDSLISGDSLMIMLKDTSSEPSEDVKPGLPDSRFDGTPFIFTITADGLSDTIMIGFVRDGADGASTGTYIGAFTERPETKADGTEIASGDFYLDVSDPSSPVPYRWKDGIWQAVTTEDPDWSYVASVTLIDVMRYATSLVSVSAYYGYFQMLAANKAFIDSLGAETITIKDGGAIESESYQETDGLEGFHIGDDGITAASGTWKGAFANGLSFIPPTEAHITADMKEKDAYLAMKRDGITEGTYFEGAQTHWIRKDDGSVFPNPPAFFAPYSERKDDPMFHFLSLAIEKHEFVRFISESGNTVFSVAESPIFGYILEAFPIASDRWLLILADVEKGTDWEENTVYTLQKKGLYILTKSSLEKLMASSDLSDTEMNISKYLVRQTGLPASWSEGELTYPMPLMDFIPYTDYVTEKTWLISQETTPALYSIALDDPSDTQFKTEGTASVTLPDGTEAAGVYFSRGIIDVNGYLRTRTIDGVDHIEASVILFTTETATSYAVIRSRNMKEWTVVAMADGETIAAVLEAKNLYPMDFMEDNGTLLMSLFNTGEYYYTFAFGRYDLETATLEVLPHEKASVRLFVNDVPSLLGGYGIPVYRYPLIRIGTMIYGSLSGLTFFSYDTETGVFTDLTRIFSSLDISTSESSSPDEFFASRNNPLLLVELAASDSPDHKAVMRAGSDLILISLTPVPDTARIFLVFLASGRMAIPAEYDTESGKLTVYPYASPESAPISESMMTSALFFGDTVLLGINGVLLFRHLDISIPEFTAPNLKPSDIAELMTPKPVETDTATLKMIDNEEKIIPYTAYPVNEDTFLLGLAGESVMGFYTMRKAGFEKLVSASPADPTPYITLFDPAYPYMTIIFYDHDEGKTHFWSMVNHTVFDMDTGDVISTTPFTVTDTSGTVLQNIIWSYGMYARAPVTRSNGKFQATAMVEGSGTAAFYHVESADGNTWTAALMRMSEDAAGGIFAGSVDTGDSWLCYRYSQSEAAMIVSLCLVPKDGTEDTVLALENFPMSDEGSMFKAIIRPALIETGGRFYAGLPFSIVSWASGETSATSVYSSDYLLSDLIKSENGLLIEEYIENAMRFRELSLDLSSGTATELKTVNGRMFDYICARSIFSDNGKRVSTHLLGDVTSDDMRVELMVSADGLTYSVTTAGIDNITDWLSGVIETGGISRYLHIFALYDELYNIVNGSYDAMNETGRAIGVPDAEILESAFIIADAAVVDVRENDDAIEIRLLPFSYELDDTIKPFSELTMQPSSLFYGYFGKCWYIGNPEIVEPFLVIHKDSDEPLGVTFHWNFPAQLTSTSPDALLRAPILRDGAMNSSADAAIPESFIDALPED